MSDSDDIANSEAALVTNATGPRRVMVDGQQVENHPLNDQIAADRYINSKVAAKKTGRGWLSGIFSRFCPPGSM